MAVTKTHPIKSTLKAAIDYICNPEKTDGKLLVSSYGCAAETADIEFAWTRRHAIDKGTNLGRHLIQAFQPGEVTPEQAHEIGMELAKEILGGKYEFVLTTHIDKDHVHNHLIFNAVSFTDHKHYHSNKRSYHDIRRTSDRLCKEHGLSVIIPGQDKGISCAECTLPLPLAVSRIRLISRFSAAVSFTVGFAACRACGSGFRFLNNGFHLLFRLGLPLQGCVEIVCLVRPLFRPQEHTADDLSGHHLQGLTMPLIHGE